MAERYRLVAWNIRAGGGARADRITASISGWAPDVAVLSEFRSTPASGRIAADLSDMGLSFQVTTTGEVDRGANALLIAARGPLRRVGLRSQPAEPGRWRMARAAPHGLAIGAMHIPNQATGRKGEYHQRVLELARRWRGGPAILVGDTNSGRIGEDEETPVFNRETHAWFDRIAAAGWRDGFRQARGDAREYTWFSHKNNGFRLDQAFLNRPLQPCLVDIRHVWAADPAQLGRRDAVSDHAALIVDLAF